MSNKPYNRTMKLLIPFSLIVGLIFPSSAQSLEEVRKQFHQAVLDPEKIGSYHDFIIEVQDTFPALLAYQAAAEAMIAQTLWNPLGKFAQVSRYEKMIEDAIYRDSDNLEIRFLRFAIEYHLPRILMMSKHLEEDRDFIIENLWRCKEMNIDPSFERYITYFMNETGMLLPNQVKKIKNILNESSAD